MKYLIILSLVSLVGCEKDPYPGDGSFIQNQRGPQVVKAPAIGFQVPEKVEFEEREVTTGLEGNDGLVEILSGLQKGEEVITFLKEE